MKLSIISLICHSVFCTPVPVAGEVFGDDVDRSTNPELSQQITTSYPREQQIIPNEIMLDPESLAYVRQQLQRFRDNQYRESLTHREIFPEAAQYAHGMNLLQQQQRKVRKTHFPETRKLTKEKLEKLVKSQAECPVCLQEVTADSSMHKLKCGHCFCESCIDQTVKVDQDYNRKCPECRHPMDEETETLEQQSQETASRDELPVASGQVIETSH